MLYLHLESVTIRQDLNKLTADQSSGYASGYDPTSRIKLPTSLLELRRDKSPRQADADPRRRFFFFDRIDPPEAGRQGFLGYFGLSGLSASGGTERPKGGQFLTVCVCLRKSAANFYAFVAAFFSFSLFLDPWVKYLCACRAKIRDVSCYHRHSMHDSRCRDERITI